MSKLKELFIRLYTCQNLLLFAGSEEQVSRMQKYISRIQNEINRTKIEKELSINSTNEK